MLGVSSPTLPAPTVSDLPVDLNGFKWMSESTWGLGGLLCSVSHRNRDLLAQKQHDIAHKLRLCLLCAGGTAHGRKALTLKLTVYSHCFIHVWTEAITLMYYVITSWGGFISIWSSSVLSTDTDSYDMPADTINGTATHVVHWWLKCHFLTYDKFLPLPGD